MYLETSKYKVEAIKDIDLLELMCDHIKEHGTKRDYTLFMFGLYSGLRISDMLRLKVKDVRGIRILKLREEKTNKVKAIEINPILKEVIKDYIKDKKDHEYLFASRKRTNGIHKAITRNRAYVILSELGEVFGLDTVGCHSMRKTFGYHYYQQTKDVGFLMKIFNHATPMQTLDYIGITQDSINQAFKTFRYK